jgi:eukaryotic-like serine/threonine-protein kinase
MAENSQREQEIFEQALELGSLEEQHAFVRGACGEDQELREGVEALLGAYVSGQGFIPTRLTTAGTVADESTPREGPGTVVGRYKLLQQIGEGGCGVVYMAEQEEPVRRRVALKVIKLGMDTKSVIARFEAERQALALMDHPNIAKVLDAGATEAGRPYFVMELVRGIKITEYCDQNNLSTRGRLDLFIQVCHAIQHAHQKGIIHRDIKPSNILVSLHDGVPVPVVIDFGIAKATEQRLTEKTFFTAFEQFIGTPAYTSPEQAEMSRLDIDTRSDIYSLGVLLYELLTGKTPFDSKELLAAGLDEMRRTIREKEPARPSTRLNTLQGEELTTTAKRRGTEAPKLIHLVRGDLDWIVMKCLEKDRTRRYETANGLALDLERHLSNEPVVARPPSWIYRFQKLVRRNKLAFTAAAALLAVLLAGVCVSTWQAVRATRAEREAKKAQANEAKQRSAAEQQRRLAQANELLARQNAYAADVKLADTALRENNMGQARTALRRQIPKPGETDIRGIEWRYLWQKCQGQQLKTFRHESEVVCAELSPDGRWLATESGGVFWVWDTTRDGERRVLSSGAPRDPRILIAMAERLAFDPQGRFLATATDSEVLIWNITDWGKLKSLPGTNASLSFSADGTMLATFGEEGIQVWKAATWEPMVRPGEIPIPRGVNIIDSIHRIALNRDGSLLAAAWQRIFAPESGEVMLWKLPQRQFLFKGEVDAVRLAFSDDDRWLAACTLGPPAMVCLWSVPEGKRVARWLASQGQGRAMAFAPAGDVLATAGSDQVIRLFETDHTNRPPRLLRGHLNEICSLRFATDGRLVSASDDQTVCLWNIGEGPSGPRPFSLPSGGLICAPGADVHRMVTVNLTSLTFEEWDMDSGQLLRQKGIQSADAILPHGTNSNGQPLQAGLMNDWLIVNLGVTNGDSRASICKTDSRAPGWDLCATTGDGRVYGWNAESGELTYSNKVAPTLGPGAYPVADHKLVLVEDAEGTLSSYDMQTHQRELLGEHYAVYSCIPKVSPDGRLFAYLSTNGWVNVWDAASKQIKSIVKPAVSLSCFEFSPDSRWLAVAMLPDRVQVFDVGTGQPVSEPLTGYLAGTIKVGFSADSKSLVTYCKDGTAKIWNIATGREMISGLPLNQFLIYHVPWRLLPSDGNSVFESAGEGAIRLVHLPTLAVIDALENGQKKGP